MYSTLTMAEASSMATNGPSRIANSTAAIPDWSLAANLSLSLRKTCISCETSPAADIDDNWLDA